MGHGPQPCPGQLSPKATEKGRLRIELERARQSLQLCPFCRNGGWAASGTKGRLTCTNCGSQALDGRKAEAVPIGGGT